VKSTYQAEQIAPTAHRQAMTRRYRWQAPLFDLTRWPVLRGRRWLVRHLRPAPRVLEVGCGTGHNLRALHRAAGPGAEVLGVECAAAMARRARRRCRPGIEVSESEFGPDSAGPIDAAVFSYSLSMIPDYEAALDQAWQDLGAGGQILVLDFVDSPLPPLRRAMRSMGVRLGEEQWSALRDRFTVRFEEERRALAGLWRYRLLVGERPPPQATQSR